MINMAKYAIIKNGMVINTCVWDGVTEWQPPEDTEVVELSEDNLAGVSYLYADGVFTPPQTSTEEGN